MRESMVRVRLWVLLITSFAAHGFTSTLALSRGRPRSLPVARPRVLSEAFAAAAGGADGDGVNLRRAVAMRGGAGDEGSHYVLVTGGAG